MCVAAHNQQWKAGVYGNAAMQAQKMEKSFVDSIYLHLKL